MGVAYAPCRMIPALIILIICGRFFVHRDYEAQLVCPNDGIHARGQGREARSYYIHVTPRIGLKVTKKPKNLDFFASFLVPRQGRLTLGCGLLRGQKKVR